MDDTAPYALVVDDDALIRMDAVYILEVPGLERWKHSTSIVQSERSSSRATISGSCSQTCKCLEVAMGSRLHANVRTDGLISRSLLHPVRRVLTRTICQPRLCS